MYHSYELPEGAPLKRVWFAICDYPDCDRFLGPFSTHQKQDQRTIVEGAGWLYGVRGDLCDVCKAEFSLLRTLRSTELSGSLLQALERRVKKFANWAEPVVQFQREKGEGHG